jgi:hypothetical protein
LPGKTYLDFNRKEAESRQAALAAQSERQKRLRELNVTLNTANVTEEIQK